MRHYRHCVTLYHDVQDKVNWRKRVDIYIPWAKSLYIYLYKCRIHRGEMDGRTSTACLHIINGVSATRQLHGQPAAGLTRI